MSGADSLSGEWDGIFNYPHHMPPQAFTATLRDEGGILTGETTESGEESRDPAVLHAWLEGRRSGDAVHFVKSYDATSRADYVVHYAGTLAPDGNEISGRWDVPGVWSGSFIMVRKAGKAEEVGEEAVEAIR
jgi:hypothetical protein